MPELYRMLGVLQASVESIQRMLIEKKDSDAALEKRVGSLERSRVRAKAWIAGATAAISAALWVAYQAWSITQALIKR